jgi:hypothetical protein
LQQIAEYLGLFARDRLSNVISGMSNYVLYTIGVLAFAATVAGLLMAVSITIH